MARTKSKKPKKKNPKPKATQGAEDVQAPPTPDVYVNGKSDAHSDNMKNVVVVENGVHQDEQPSVEFEVPPVSESLYVEPSASCDSAQMSTVVSPPAHPLCTSEVDNSATSFGMSSAASHDAVVQNLKITSRKLLQTIPQTHTSETHIPASEIGDGDGDIITESTKEALDGLQNALTLLETKVIEIETERTSEQTTMRVLAKNVRERLSSVQHVQDQLLLTLDAMKELNAELQQRRESPISLDASAVNGEKKASAPVRPPNSRVEGHAEGPDVRDAATSVVSYASVDNKKQKKSKGFPWWKWLVLWSAVGGGSYWAYLKRYGDSETVAFYATLVRMVWMYISWRVRWLVLAPVRWIKSANSAIGNGN